MPSISFGVSIHRFHPDAVLAARYWLEPSLQDLYVEGVRDRNIYDWYLKETGHGDVSVLHIDLIAVDRETCEAYSLGEGNRNRVIALALELDRQFPSGLSRVRCIVDSDFDFILELPHRASYHLLYTDYTSIDLYTCDKELFDQGLLSRLEIPRGNLQPLFTSMFRPLKELFVMRASNQVLQWGMNILSMTRCCTIVDSMVTFDREDFVNRWLQTNNRVRDRDEFEFTCADLDAVHLDDFRKGVHSEDYLELVGWYLHHYYHWRGYRGEARSILGPLTAVLKAELLSDEPLFSQLNEIYC